jgi:hypothetical protein
MYLGYHQIILFKISYWISVKFKKKKKKKEIPLSSWMNLRKMEACERAVTRINILKKNIELSTSRLIWISNEINALQSITRQYVYTSAFTLHAIIVFRSHNQMSMYNVIELYAVCNHLVIWIKPFESACSCFYIAGLDLKLPPMNSKTLFHANIIYVIYRLFSHLNLTTQVHKTYGKLRTKLDQ